MVSVSPQLIIPALIIATFAAVIAKQFLPPPPPTIIGIDLGTTYSCVSSFKLGVGGAEIIADKDNNLVIPSIIAYTIDGKILTGYDAKKQQHNNLKNTFYDIKRIIGRKWDKDLQEEVKKYPFNVVGVDGYPYLEVIINETRTLYSPSEISAELLKQLKKTAEIYLNRQIKEVVLAAPVEFDESQRNATSLAGKLAGLDVFRIINEPTSAAMAYGLHEKEAISLIIIYDMGGGTLDVSLLAVEYNVFETLSVSGDTHLGGQDLNKITTKYFQEKIKQKYDLDISKDNSAMQLLADSVENLKLELSSKNESILQFNIPSKNGEIHLYEELTRKEFEKINSEFWDLSLIPVKEVLQEMEVTPKEIDEIVLIGGSTRLPKIQNLLHEFFNKKPSNRIDPDQAVAQGTAIQAGIMRDLWPVNVAAIEKVYIPKGNRRRIR